MIDRTPPDVRRAIEAKGIYLTGGIANLRGLTTYLEGSIGLPVMTVPNPELCAVKGLQKIILHKAYYKKLTYSMLDENYRWIKIMKKKNQTSAANRYLLLGLSLFCILMMVLSSFR